VGLAFDLASRVHRQRAGAVRCYADGVKAQPGGRRGAAHSEDHLFCLDHQAAVQQCLGLPAGGSLQGLDLGAEPDVDVAAAQRRWLGKSGNERRFLCLWPPGVRQRAAPWAG